MTELVNILIPFYNAETTLEQSLLSVQQQTYTNWKVILINDGSNDSSVNIAEKFLQKNPGKGILITSIEPKSGPAVGRNAGLKHADGLYVICLDSDDILAPFCIDQRVSVMQKHLNIQWAVFNQYLCSPGQAPPYELFNKPVNTREEAIKVFLQMEVAWQTMAPIWKTETLKQLGGFDETLFPSEDPDLHLRALLNKEVNILICKDLAADCYYVWNKPNNKILLFYSQSIESKFRLLKKTIFYLPAVVSPQILKTYRPLLRKGFFNFFNAFLLARLRHYKKEVKEITQLLREAQILKPSDLFKIKLINKIFTSDSFFIKQLKIRGIIHKLFMRYLH